MDFQNKGILSKLSTAWSRDQKNKIYVQDVMAQEGKEIWSWLNEGAYFYVCGDAKYMAKDDSCLHEIIGEHGKMNSESYIKEMKKENAIKEMSTNIPTKVAGENIDQDQKHGLKDSLLASKIKD